MYNLEGFEPYTLRKHLGTEVVLAWSLKNGYHFLTLTERLMALGDLKIIAVEKSK